MKLTITSLFILFLFAFDNDGEGKGKEIEIGILPKVTIPSENLQTKEKVELGKMLFFDPRLSGNNSISCASCHSPAFGFSDNLPRAIGTGDKELGRNSPTIINAAYNFLQFWDGRAKSLEEQALGPIASPTEMAQDLGELEEELSKIPLYQKKFTKIFGKEGITTENIAKVIAAYERTIISHGSKFEHFLHGSDNALSDEEKRGLELFKGKANCIRCHNGPNLTDNGFHNIGVTPQGPLKEDLGRFAVIPVKVMKKAFKTPTLWDCEKTKPYMHNGSLSTLEEVIEFYNKGGEDREGIDPEMKELNLTKKEKKELLSFLKSLSGKSFEVVIPELP
ncbi:MAG: cytochrome-c peroxidase [Nitrospinae bacterium]|nr:cytochrome-c peroxidase [Nitrospinota bacterium]